MTENEKGKDEKKNTDLWKLKQEEKKKKKELEQAKPEVQKDNAQNKKADKKQKAKAKKQEKQPEQKIEVVQKIQVKAPEPILVYKALTKIQCKLSQQEKRSIKAYQQGLIIKEMQQFTSKQDVVLFIGDKPWYPACSQVYIKDFNNCPQAELVCLYPDISYFLENSVTKIFLGADYIFANGSILAKKGAFNITLLAQYYNTPVIGCGGSWNYNSWAPLSEEALTQRYSKSIIEKYDWIEAKYLKSFILQVGPVNPKQVSIYPPIIYKGTDISKIE